MKTEDILWTKHKVDCVHFWMSLKTIFQDQKFKDWPENFFVLFDKPNDTLVEEMYQYGRENLALIHVMIQSPYVTKIKRDVAMKLTGFIANTGGLLGLCLGFSFISCIEFIFWCGCYCFKSKCSH